MALDDKIFSCFLHSGRTLWIAHQSSIPTPRLLAWVDWLPDAKQATFYGLVYVERPSLVGNLHTELRIDS